MFIFGLSQPIVEAYLWFPSGDWWAIDANDHYYGVYEGVPDQDHVKWVCDFYWDENKWPEDQYYQYDPPWGPTIYVDTWYFHELRRIQYGVSGDTDQDVMDAISTYYTTCPSPHELSIEEYKWWVPDFANSDEELELVLKEPGDCNPGTLYTFRAYFEKKADYHEYRMQFESEWANHVESPPEEYQLIEYDDYYPPSVLTQHGTSTETLQNSNDTIPDEPYYSNDIESPVLSVRYSGGHRPYLQTVVQGDYDSEIIISEYARLDSIDRLHAFIDAKNRDIVKLDSSIPTVDAIISFNREITLNELLIMQERYKLDIEWLRFLSSEGGGKMFINNGTVSTTVQEMETEFEADFGSEFELVEGIGAIKAAIPFKLLDEFRSESSILVIDVGPMELVSEMSSKHNEATIQPKWYDIFQEYAILLDL